MTSHPETIKFKRIVWLAIFQIEDFSDIKQYGINQSETTQSFYKLFSENLIYLNVYISRM